MLNKWIENRPSWVLFLRWTAGRIFDSFPEFRVYSRVLHRIFDKVWRFKALLADRSVGIILTAVVEDLAAMPKGRKQSSPILNLSPGLGGGSRNSASSPETRRLSPSYEEFQEFIEQTTCTFPFTVGFRDCLNISSVLQRPML